MTANRPAAAFPPNVSDLTHRLLEQVQSIENFSGILLKSQCDGYLDTFFRVFDSIFRKERQYTVEGGFTRNQKDSPGHFGRRTHRPPRIQPLYLQG